MNRKNNVEAAYSFFDFQYSFVLLVLYANINYFILHSNLF